MKPKTKYRFCYEKQNVRISFHLRQDEIKHFF